MEYYYNTTYFPTLAVDAPREWDFDLPFFPPFGGPAAEPPFAEHPQPPFQEVPQLLLAHPNQQVDSSGAGGATNTGDRVRADAPEVGQKQVEVRRVTSLAFASILLTLLSTRTNSPRGGGQRTQRSAAV